ncbi:aliphatic sulfonate ABC transporter, substrate-binding protein [Sorangium cellulosum So ce56]|uniref:Putative aliphatic sulfonates-binding protein n=1 Tax=Sorangium cellulosum (strain So ce56) TaxID=448385 RepID=A9FK54_SORC5|nr:sulfonate ABC transporter substrate-binding protein [Sorangium cellulosum]CAN95082.1 aliphatic sulfonate ABC transporter, substrate-binding protein [Sorangium cellulosum So ce56]
MIRYISFTTVRSALLGCAALSSLLLLGCGRDGGEVGATGEKAANAGQAAEDTRAAAVVVRLGYQKIGTPFLLKERAEALTKALEARNARAEWVEFQAGPPLLEAMRAGAVDVGHVGETPPVFAQAGGVPFVYAATDAPAPRAEAIVVKKDSPIRTLAALKGKRVALNRGSNVHYLLVRALESAGLTLDDIQVVFLAPADARTAFEGGNVDAWVIWDPFLAAAELAGARVLQDGEGLVDNRLFYVVRREFAEEQPAILQIVFDEYRALSAWEDGHREEASQILARSSGISYEAFLRSEHRRAFQILPITPEIVQRQQAIADTFHKLAIIPRDIRVEDALLPGAAIGGAR